MNPGWTERRAFLWSLLFVGIIAISFSAIFVKWTDAPVSVIGMYRLGLTLVGMTPFLFRYRAELGAVSGRDWALLGLSGFMLALHFLLWMGSLRYTTVASSTVLMTLEPVLVMIGALIFFRERIRGAAVAAMGVALIGAVLIGWGDFRLSGTALYGDLLSILGTLAVVVHMLLGQALRGRISSFVYSYTVFLAAAAAFAVYNLAAGFSFFGYASNDWLIFALMAAVPTVFGHLLFNWLLKYTGATTVSMAVLGEPVGASLLAWALLDERLTALQAFAGALLIGGVWLFLRSGGHRHGDEAEASEVSGASATEDAAATGAAPSAQVAAVPASPTGK
ncbi:DMT family transporter [Paenibacillus antri]|uniref:DMT family transporter n=1 Tax=Paenibacillus antri TaxID=2582848 RepID=A0A5R9G557_9BACL|nr:DMT family transporter [Paenibacillus antri]TLS49466.1 DMT family transporter [Paenibacillus antri]